MFGCHSVRGRGFFTPPPPHRARSGSLMMRTSAFPSLCEAPALSLTRGPLPLLSALTWRVVQVSHTLIATCMGSQSGFLLSLTCQALFFASNKPAHLVRRTILSVPSASIKVVCLRLRSLFATSTSNYSADCWLQYVESLDRNPLCDQVRMVQRCHITQQCQCTTTHCGSAGEGSLQKY